jgi:hypothetical protein
MNFTRETIVIAALSGVATIIGIIALVAAWWPKRKLGVRLRPAFVQNFVEKPKSIDVESASRFGEGGDYYPWSTPPLVGEDGPEIVAPKGLDMRHLGSGESRSEGVPIEPFIVAVVPPEKPKPMAIDDRSPPASVEEVKMRLLPKSEWKMHQGPPGTIIIGAYEHPPGYRHYVKVALLEKDLEARELLLPCSELIRRNLQPRKRAEDEAKINRTGLEMG